MSYKENDPRAKEVYAELVRIVDSKKWENIKDETNMLITNETKANGVIINFALEVLPDYEIVEYKTEMPFTVPINRRADMAVAVSVLNLFMVNSAFLFDFRTGGIFLRIGTRYTETELSVTLIKEMISLGIITASQYYVSLQQLAEGKISLSKFIEKNEEF